MKLSAADLINILELLIDAKIHNHNSPHVEDAMRLLDIRDTCIAAVEGLLTEVRKEEG